MGTTINANGSRWAGQKPATIEELYIVLTEHPIDDFWHKRGPSSCIHVEPDGVVKFWGNFADVSHVFDVDTDDPEVIARLTALIKENLKHPPKGQTGARLHCRCIAAHFGRFEEEERDAGGSRG